MRKCEWCKEVLDDNPIRWWCHEFCSVGCKLECLNYYDVPDTPETEFIEPEDYYDGDLQDDYDYDY